MNESLLTELLNSLDTVVMERHKDSSFSILGKLPVWVKHLFDDIEPDKEFAIDDELTFLGSFIIDAAIFWRKKQAGKILWSGPWEETIGPGQDAEMEAGAVYLQDRNVLFVRLIGHNAIADRETLQKTREHLLSFENLFRAEQDLEKYSNYLEEKVQQRTLQVRKTLSGVIQAIIKITELRDPYTAGHQRRVAELACAVAIEMKRPAEEIEVLQIAGSLHDIGKIYVPAEILSKPGRLNDIEVAIIRTHCQAGYDILKNIDFPGPIAHIILQHHENIDGSGYPAGLSNGEILIESRIMRVADVVEAMSSDRPYRPALGTEKSIDEIKKNRGILYDSRVVDACLALLEKNDFKFGPAIRD
jgi:putative nucleotidyltransferase with HDIG domain